MKKMLTRVAFIAILALSIAGAAGQASAGCTRLVCPSATPTLPVVGEGVSWE